LASPHFLCGFIPHSPFSMVMIKGESLPCYMSMSETHSSPKPRNIRMKVETPPILPSKGGASVIVVFIIHNLEFIIMPRKRPRLWRRQVR